MLCNTYADRIVKFPGEISSYVPRFDDATRANRVQLDPFSVQIVRDEINLQNTYTVPRQFVGYRRRNRFITFLFAPTPYVSAGNTSDGAFDVGKQNAASPSGKTDDDRQPSSRRATPPSAVPPPGAVGTTDSTDSVSAFFLFIDANSSDMVVGGSLTVVETRFPSGAVSTRVGDFASRRLSV